MNTAHLGHRREGPGGYSGLCSQLPAFCSWSVGLATETRPVPTCCLWDLGFLILKSPGGALKGMWPLWGYGGFNQDAHAGAKTQAKTLPQEGPPHQLQMGMSWGGHWSAHLGGAPAH